MTRIIAGQYKGFRLFSPKHAIRPTADRVKEYIFDVLRDIAGCRVLDLFSGTGSLGLEAVSRGAETVDLVENSRNSIELIKRNIEKMHCESSVTVLPKNALTFCSKLSEHYDLIFADPPYALDIPGTFYTDVNEALTKNGIFVFEYSSALHTEQYPVLRDGKFKKFGETGVWFHYKSA